MPANELLRKGQLRETLAELQARVREEPAAARHRVFLFQLLCVTGQWDRALTQLNVAAELDAANLLMAQIYRPALTCEALRDEVFAGKRLPLVFGEPEEWMSWMIEANRLTAQGQASSADALRAKALEAAPAVPGVMDGKAFEWLADADPRLGPLLEIIINGQYFWVPIQRVAGLKFEAPSDLRDVVWSPVICTWTNGGVAAGLMPTRYPGSDAAEDSIQLARKTDWVDNGRGTTVGLGQRVWATDQGEYALLDTRQIMLHPPS